MFPSEQINSGLGSLDDRKKQRYGTTDTLDSICNSETGNISYGQMDTWIDVG